jgi:hypothetical protein
MAKLPASTRCEALRGNYFNWRGIMTANSGSFSKTNQPKVGSKQGKRGRNKRNLFLEALTRQSKTEEDFYDLMVERAFQEGDIYASKELLSRLYPVPKATMPLVNFEFPKGAKPHEQAASVLEAIAGGEIPSDIGSVFMQAIKVMIDIDEYTDLKERIHSIEESLGVTNG